LTKAAVLVEGSALGGLELGGGGWDPCWRFATKICGQPFSDAGQIKRVSLEIRFGVFIYLYHLVWIVKFVHDRVQPVSDLQGRRQTGGL